MAKLSSTVIYGDLKTTGNSDLDGYVNIKQSLTIDELLYVTGQSQFIGQTKHDGGILANGGTFTNKTYHNAGLNSTTGTFSSNITVAGTLGVTGSSTLAGALQVNNTITSNNIIKTTNTTGSTSTTTGALQSAGGLGVVGNANIGGAVTITGKTNLNGNSYAPTSEAKVFQFRHNDNSGNRGQLRYDAFSGVGGGYGVIFDTSQIGTTFKNFIFSGTETIYADGKLGLGVKDPKDTIHMNGGIIATGDLSLGTYVSGWGGSGVRISSDGTAEFTNVFVRGEFTVNELIANQIRGTNGDLVVTDTAKIKSVNGRVLTIDGETNEYNPFKVGDVIMCQRFRADTKASVKLYKASVTAINNLTFTIGANTEGSGVPEPGDIVIRFSSTDDNRKGIIYLASSANGAPFVDVMYGGTVKSRYGRLSGITDTELGALSGYGLYSDNVYLKGAIVASSGKIGGWRINASTITGGNVTLNSAGSISNGTKWSLNNDGSGQIASNNIKWTAAGTVTLGPGVKLQWTNLDEEAQTNLKGEDGAPGKDGAAGSKGDKGDTGAAGTPGKDANLLDWVSEWNTNATTIDGSKVITPKLFAGTKDSSNKLTGVAIGTNIFGTSGTHANMSGIFGLKSDTKTFAMNLDGSGFIGNNKIKWDTSGNITFADDVKLSWSKLTGSPISIGVKATQMGATGEAYIIINGVKVISITTAKRGDTWYIIDKNGTKISTGTSDTYVNVYTSIVSALNDAADGSIAIITSYDATGIDTTYKAALANYGINVAVQTANRTAHAFVGIKGSSGIAKTAFGTNTSDYASINVSVIEGKFDDRLTSIDGNGIYTGTLTADQIMATNFVAKTANIGDAVITNAKIGNLSVNTAKIADAAITNAKIDNLAVTTAKIQDAAIQTAKIGDAQITTAKINNLAVDAAKIKDAAIETAKIKDAAITNAKINDLNANKITAGYISADRIQAGSLNGNKITSGTINLDQLSAEIKDKLNGAFDTDEILTPTEKQSVMQLWDEISSTYPKAVENANSYQGNASAKNIQPQIDELEIAYNTVYAYLFVTIHSSIGNTLPLLADLNANSAVNAPALRNTISNYWVKYEELETAKGQTIIQGGYLQTDIIKANSITADHIATNTITALGAVTGGSFNLGSGKFQVTSAGVLTATGATISGTLTATAGTIGGWTVTSSSIQTGAYNTSGTRYFGTSGLSMSNTFVVTAAGSLTATSGAVAGWTLNSSGLYRGTLNNTLAGYTSASGSITIGSNGIRGFKWYIDSDGKAAFGGGKFTVDASGNIIGRNSSNSTIFQLGSTNKIAGWDISTEGFSSSYTKTKFTSTGDIIRQDEYYPGAKPNLIRDSKFRGIEEIDILKERFGDIFNYACQVPANQGTDGKITSNVIEVANTTSLYKELLDNETVLKFTPTSSSTGGIAVTIARGTKTLSNQEALMSSSEWANLIKDLTFLGLRVEFEIKDAVSTSHRMSVYRKINSPSAFDTAGSVVSIPIKTTTEWQKAHVFFPPCLLAEGNANGVYLQIDCNNSHNSNVYIRNFKIISMKRKELYDQPIRIFNKNHSGIFSFNKNKDYLTIMSATQSLSNQGYENIITVKPNKLYKLSTIMRQSPDDLLYNATFTTGKIAIEYINSSDSTTWPEITSSNGYNWVHKELLISTGNTTSVKMRIGSTSATSPWSIDVKYLKLEEVTSSSDLSTPWSPYGDDDYIDMTTDEYGKETSNTITFSSGQSLSSIKNIKIVVRGNSQSVENRCRFIKFKKHDGTYKELTFTATGSGTSEIKTLCNEMIVNTFPIPTKATSGLTPYNATDARLALELFDDKIAAGNYINIGSDYGVIDITFKEEQFDIESLVMSNYTMTNTGTYAKIEVYASDSKNTYKLFDSYNNTGTYKWDKPYGYEVLIADAGIMSQISMDKSGVKIQGKTIEIDGNTIIRSEGKTMNIFGGTYNGEARILSITNVNNEEIFMVDPNGNSKFMGDLEAKSGSIAGMTIYNNSLIANTDVISEMPSIILSDKAKVLKISPEQIKDETAKTITGYTQTSKNVVDTDNKRVKIPFYTTSAGSTLTSLNITEDGKYLISSTLSNFGQRLNTLTICFPNLNISKFYNYIDNYLAIRYPYNYYFITRFSYNIQGRVTYSLVFKNISTLKEVSVPLKLSLPCTFNYSMNSMGTIPSNLETSFTATLSNNSSVITLPANQYADLLTGTYSIELRAHVNAYCNLWSETEIRRLYDDKYIGDEYISFSDFSISNSGFECGANEEFAFKSITTLSTNTVVTTPLSYSKTTLGTAISAYGMLASYDASNKFGAYIENNKMQIVQKGSIDAVLSGTMYLNNALVNGCKLLAYLNVHVSSSSATYAGRFFSKGFSVTSISRNGTGIARINHNIGHTNYIAMATGHATLFASVQSINTTYFEVRLADDSSANDNGRCHVFIYDFGGTSVVPI